MGKATVQIVEDERIVAEDMRQFLEAAGYDVCGIAKDNATAIELAEEHQPDIILMDIVIRGELDGIDTAAMIKERFGIPVIYLTAYSQEGVLERAKPTQPLAYLVKPFKETSLISTLEMALHKSVLDAQVARSAELFYTTLKSIGDGVLSTDAEGNVVFMNRIAEELTGWSFREARGRPVEEIFVIVSGKTGHQIEIPCLVAMETGVVHTLERGTQLVRRDGSRISVDDSGAPVHDAQGELTGSVLVFRDVTIEEERDQKLSDYRARLEDMVQERTSELERRISLETMISEVGSRLIQCEGDDFDRVLEEGLERIGEFDGLQLAAVLGGSIREGSCAWAPGGVDMEACGELLGALFDESAPQLEAGASVAFDDLREGGGRVGEVARSLGVHSLLAIELGGFDDPEAVLVLGSERQQHWPDDERCLFIMLGATVYGVTQRERRESERLRLVEELQQARKMEAIGKLSGGIAHDFNNMLVPIIGYSESLLNSGKAGAAGEMAAILKAARNAADLTKQLLAFSRKQILLKKPTDVSRLVRELRDMLDRILGEGTELVTHLVEEPWCVHADRGQLEQVILNLCVNARDAMPGGGRIAIEVENTTFGESDESYVDGDFVKVTVSDEGAGIPGDILDRIFEPFFTSKGPNGTGLGLSVVLGIVEQHGGWIDIDSSEGKGSAFRVFLPADRSAELPRIRRKRVPSGRERREVEGAVSVLLVEDEPSVMTFVSQVLKNSGYLVSTADSRESAFEVLNKRADEFDLLFTDAMLPDGTGIDVINRAKSIAPGINTLLSSGYSDDRSLLAQAEAQDIDFLSKPYSIDELLAAVAGALGPEQLPA